MDPFRTWKFSLADRIGVPKEHMSNAWLKCYELLSVFRKAFRLDRPGKTYRVFCNAEFPGAFILCMQHYFSTNVPEVSLEWVASSLVPAKGNTALCDKYGLFTKYPDRWLMGEECDGDITKSSTIQYFSKNVEKVDLYTSDFGMDVSGDPNQQEALHFRGNIGQILCGLKTIKKRGNMLFKTFALYKKLNAYAIELLHALFDMVVITKPIASRLGNSELYVVCINYKGPDDIILAMFHRLFCSEQCAADMVTLHSNLDEIVRGVTSTQINQLKKSVHAYNSKKRPDAKEFATQIELFEKQCHV